MTLHKNPNDIMCCGIRVTNTCPMCGATDLYAKHLAEQGLDTEPVGESHHVEGLAEEFPTEAPVDPAEAPAADADAPEAPAPEPKAPRKKKKGE